MTFLRKKLEYFYNSFPNAHTAIVQPSDEDPYYKENDMIDEEYINRKKELQKYLDKKQDRQIIYHDSFVKNIY